MLSQFRRVCRPSRLLFVVVALAAAAAPPAQAQRVDYRRAERMLGWNAERLVVNAAGAPNWLADDSRFWYRASRAEGHEFVLVDPVRNVVRPVFDHARLAAALSLAADTTYDAVRLPFQRFEFADGEDSIELTAGGRRFRCGIRQYACTVLQAAATRPASHVRSPDGRWEAYIHEHDVHVRPAGGGDAIRLTHDGEAYWSYGNGAPGPNQLISGAPRRPLLEWSPDSRRIAIERLDQRHVEHLPIYSSTSLRPRGFTYPYALPGDTVVPEFDIHIIDVETRANARVAMERQPFPALGLAGLRPDGTWAVVRWTPDGRQLYFTHATRGVKRVQLMAADASTGQVRLIARDSSTSYVELKMGARLPPNWAVLGNGERALWFSQRDGWGHLYLYDGAGEAWERLVATGANGGAHGGAGSAALGMSGGGRVLRQITSGPWVVDELKHVDERAGVVYFTAWGREPGRNPYHSHLYRIGLDGSGLRLLTPEDAHHAVDFSPDGRFFIDTYSRIDSPPIMVLRASGDGRLVRTLEAADITQLVQQGWSPPEPFRAKARDGVTDIYGVLFKPSGFDPSRRYPIINHIYPGPQVGSMMSWGFNAAPRNNVRALAELGFIVVQIDHMGTPARSKAFHDAWYGDLADHGLPDHVAAMRQLAAARPYIDLDRVGIYGSSGGGFASTAALLQYPDFFHVAVSTSGNHDNRTYGHYWGEKYQGLLVRDTVRGTDNYTSQDNALRVENLKGRLFLLTGDMDDNVHPAMTLRLAHALIAANKDFDFLILPDRAHALGEPYVIRRIWDYFVTHLMGAEPPREYRIERAPGG